MADKNLPNLSTFELRGTEDIAQYSAALRDTGRALALEVDYTAAELQTILAKAGMTLGDKLTARLKARKVTRRLRRYRDLQNGAAIEAVKFWATYRAEYDTLFRPAHQQPNKWHWNA